MFIMSVHCDIQENLKRGTMEMLILKLLSEEDMYGYQIKNELAARSHGAVTIREGSLYAPLYRLIEKKYIAEERRPAGVRRIRVYYHLLEEGKAYLNLLSAEYAKMAEGVRSIMEGSANNA